MVHLGRQIRFSVDPFLDDVEEGCNSYSSKPAGAGLAVFLELTVELLGPVDPETGFVINCNSYSSKPAGAGLAVFLELTVELLGPVDPETGFVINVTEIDDRVREFATVGAGASTLT